MINSIKRFAIWLRRIAYCRGFGIQSPWAYGFVRYVINQHNPYYAYEELRHRWRVSDRTVLKKLELLFRLSNFAQPKLVTLSQQLGGNGMTEGYIKAGCRKAEICSFTDADDVLHRLGACDGKALVYADLHVTDVPDSKRLMGALRTGDFLFADNINRHGDARRRWKEMLAHPDATLCFDLYYCGIVYHDPERHKQNYMINF